jgi:catechol 2,3-dioxygenase-like lactoylglutathione lyase family enzyme
MVSITGLDHVVLRVRDLDRALAFYRDVLGLAIERELPPEIGLVQLRAGAALVDLVPVDGAIGRQGGAPAGEEGRNMDHFCLQVEPFDEAALRAHLATHGIPAGPTESRYGARGNGPSIYVRDPDGNTVELKGPSAIERNREE